MGIRIEGVTDKLIQVATEEFLLHGFQEASLRTIAEKAGTSTKSIYIRFKDKESLFNSIVDKAITEFRDLYINSITDFEQNHSEVTYTETFEYTDLYIDKMIDCIYDNYSAFRLLICYSDRGKCSEFINSIAEIETEETKNYISRFENINISDELIHILSTSYISGLFEIVRHEMTRLEAKQYSTQLKEFFRVGWANIFSK